MKIKSIKIFDAFGEKGKLLEAKFNDDVTLIYGENGCGKTTLLNILSIMISGKIYELRNYMFSEIIIMYEDAGSNKEIVIKKSVEKGKNLFNLDFNGEQLHFESNDERRSMEYNDNLNCFFENHSLCKRIKDSFNIVYLPLNRYDNYFEEDVYYRLGGRNFDKSYLVYLNKSIFKIQKIVKDYIVDMMLNK